MFYPPNLAVCGKLRSAGIALVVLVFLPLLFVPTVKGQSVRGFQAPGKTRETIQTSDQVRAARGEVPLRKVYGHLKVDPSKISHLPVPTANEKQKQPAEKVLQIGIVRPLGRPLDPFADGQGYRVPEGGVQVLGVVTEGAIYTRLHFTEVSLPVGSRIFVYSMNNPDEFYGPYEGQGPSETGSFWTPPLRGEGVVVEYFTPNPEVNPLDGPFKVGEVSHIFRDAFETVEAGLCNLEVNSEWSNVAKSVGMLQFVKGSYEALCTGTLLNDQANDQIPFVLTANHCISSQTEAQSLRVYWNYNTGDTPPIGTPSTDGANLLSTSSFSDYCLVRMTGALPGGLFFSGWSADSVSVGTPVTGLHHPDGSHKRISFGSTNSTCLANSLPGPCTSFTHVGWNAGVTEPGSSGSGLWIGPGTNAMLVGTLTGGLSSCGNPAGNDEYGSFSETYRSIAPILNPIADVSISIYTAPQVPQGAKIVYLITVTNNFGPQATNITVNDTLPPEVSFFSCYSTNGCGSSASNNAILSFHPLAAGESASAILTVKVNDGVASGTVIQNSLTVSTTTPDVNHANDVATTTVTVGTSALPIHANGRIVFASDRAFSNSTQPSGFYTINPDGTGESILWQGEPFGSAPAWSPDGKKIAFGKRTGSITYGDEIYSANPDGTNRIRLAANVNVQNKRIAWSPDGTKLAFEGDVLRFVNSDGTENVRFEYGGPGNDLAWHPSGVLRFAFSNGSDIFVQTLGAIFEDSRTNLTQGKVMLFGEPALNTSPHWSPDGTKILFSAVSNNYGQIWVMNADGSDLHAIVTLPHCTYPAWSPDGSKIVFVSVNELYVANADGSSPVQITNNHFYNSKPDWQPLYVAPTVQLSSTGYSVTEGSPEVSVVVTRAGDTSAVTTIDYATSDSGSTNDCAGHNGAASSRCDYLTKIGTLHFAANETSKTISIPIIDDSYAESSESFTITLSNAAGATLGPAGNASITINDNDAADASNPTDIPGFFVRQHYIDFLNRQPDSGGLDYWSNQITECGLPGATCDAVLRRINVSAAFFLSIEFQETGYLVERLYKVAYGDAAGTSNVGPTHQIAVPIVRLNEFLPDSQEISRNLVVGQPGWDQVIENNKTAFITQFVQRTRFTTALPESMSPIAFVDKLFFNAGITPATAERNSIIGEFGGAGNTGDIPARARALRRVAENAVLAQQERNKAFVLMQYFGYLRRNPNDPQDTDHTGYDFWLHKLDQFNGNFEQAQMVQAFIESIEYRTRFAP